MRKKVFAISMGLCFILCFFAGSSIKSSAVITPGAVEFHPIGSLVPVTGAPLLFTEWLEQGNGFVEGLPKNKEIITEELPIGTNKLELHMIQKKKGIMVGWEKIEQASKYEIYLTGEDGVEKLWKTTKAAKTALHLQVNKSYKVKVRVLNKKKKVLASSKKYTIYLPKKVGKLRTCSLEKDSVRIEWTAQGRADRYKIYRKEEGEEEYKEIGQSRKCRYMDKGIEEDKSYHYKVVPVKKAGVITFTGAGAVKKFNNQKIVATDHQKYTYQEMSADLRRLKEKYDGLIHYKVIGKSEDGRNIYDVILGNKEADKSILVVSTLHAREYMASLLCMNQMEYYLQHYYGEIGGEKTQDILKKIAIHYIPMANPDGVEISQNGISAIRKASIAQKLYRISEDAVELWKANANGVDLNRNFPYKFQKFGEPGSQGFSGTAAASESETRTVLALIQDLKEKHNLQGVINYHAMGSIVFGSCKKGGKLKKITKEMYRLARNVTGYISAKEYVSNTSKYGDAGNLREYLLYKEKIPSITLEIGTNPCPGPISEFPSIWSRNCDLVLKEAKLFL